jgi:hypothetical protein
MTCDLELPVELDPPALTLRPGTPCIIIQTHNSFNRCTQCNHILIISQRRMHTDSLTWCWLITWNGTLIYCCELFYDLITETGSSSSLQLWNGTLIYCCELFHDLITEIGSSSSLQLRLSLQQRWLHCARPWEQQWHTLILLRAEKLHCTKAIVGGMVNTKLSNLQVCSKVPCHAVAMRPL